MSNIIIKYMESIGNYEKQLKKMLIKYDDDFLPPLSSRVSTSQIDEGISNYLNGLKNQKFIIAVKGDTMLAFLSFINYYHLKYIENFYPANYISTVIVTKEYRNKGIATGLYDKFLFNLPEEVKLPYAITRTWSTNTIHNHLLIKFGFELVYKIKDHRGKGIDTLYYGIKLH